MRDRQRHLGESLNEIQTKAFLRTKGFTRVPCDNGLFSPGPLLYILEEVARQREEHFAFGFLPSVIFIPTPMEIIAGRTESIVRLSGDVMYYAIVQEASISVHQTRKSYAQYHVNLQNFFNGEKGFVF